MVIFHNICKSSQYAIHLKLIQRCVSIISQWNWREQSKHLTIIWKSVLEISYLGNGEILLKTYKYFSYFLTWYNYTYVMCMQAYQGLLSQQLTAKSNENIANSLLPASSPSFFLTSTPGHKSICSFVFIILVILVVLYYLYACQKI